MIKSFLFSFFCIISCILHCMDEQLVKNKTGNLTKKGKETVVVFIFGCKKPLQIVNETNMVIQTIRSKELSAFKAECVETSAGNWQEVRLKRIGFPNPDFTYKPTGKHAIINLLYKTDGSFDVQEFIGSGNELKLDSEKNLK